MPNAMNVTLNVSVSLKCCGSARNLKRGPMAATWRFRLLLGPPTLRESDLWSRLAKISTWSALQYFAISKRWTRNWKDQTCLVLQKYNNKSHFHHQSRHVWCLKAGSLVRLWSYEVKLAGKKRVWNHNIQIWSQVLSNTTKFRGRESLCRYLMPNGVQPSIIILGYMALHIGGVSG